MTGLQLLEAVNGRLGNATMEFVSVVNTTLRIISNKLWEKNSGFLKTDMNITVGQNVTRVSCPEGFLGFVEPPYFERNDTSARTKLLPLPMGADGSYTKTGVPEFYDLRGASISLYPTSSVLGNIKGRVYRLPTMLTTINDDIPFDGYFDDVIMDAVVQVSSLGMAVCTSPVFSAFINQQVVTTLHKRSPKTAYFKTN